MKSRSALLGVRPEKEIKKDLKKRFDEWGAWHFSPPANGYGRNGIPDHIVCVPVLITQAMVGQTLGLFAAVEAKAEGRRNEQDRGASSGQVREMTAITRAEGMVTLADSVDDLAAIEAFIGFTSNK